MRSMLKIAPGSIPPEPCTSFHPLIGFNPVFTNSLRRLITGRFRPTLCFAREASTPATTGAENDVPYSAYLSRRIITNGGPQSPPSSSLGPDE